jgi:hypothetical protein
MVPHELPLLNVLRELIADLPLVIDTLVDEPTLYLAVLQIPPQYALQGGPLKLQVCSASLSNSLPVTVRLSSELIAVFCWPWLTS